MNRTEKELSKFENLENEEINNQMQAINKLLLEMLKNQKENVKNMMKIFIITIVCYTIILLIMIASFVLYEGQFETIDSQYMIEQSAESDNNGNAIVNNGGDVNYGESYSGD